MYKWLPRHQYCGMELRQILYTYIQKHDSENLPLEACYIVLAWPAKSLRQLHLPPQTRGAGCEVQSLVPITQLQPGVWKETYQVHLEGPFIHLYSMCNFQQ